MLNRCKQYLESQGYQACRLLSTSDNTNFVWKADDHTVRFVTHKREGAEVAYNFLALLAGYIKTPPVISQVRKEDVLIQTFQFWPGVHASRSQQHEAIRAWLGQDVDGHLDTTMRESIQMWQGPMRSMPNYLPLLDPGHLVIAEYEQIYSDPKEYLTEPLRPIHSDLNHTNILYHPKIGPFLIDWDNLSLGPAWVEWIKFAMYFGLDHVDARVKKNEYFQQALRQYRLAVIASMTVGRFPVRNEIFDLYRQDYGVNFPVR